MAAAHDFDCLIIGGGMVGASLACALGGKALRVGVAEAVPFDALDQPSYDDRGLALSPASRRILQGLGLWSSLAPETTPIRRIHVSDRGHFGFTRLDCDAVGMEALGHVVLARAIGKALMDSLGVYDNVEYLCPAQSNGVRVRTEHIEVSLRIGDVKRTVTTRLLIAADGGNSAVRKQLGVDAERYDYGQTAVVANVTPEGPHNNIAYERFTRHGPLALLPSSMQRYAVVWTVRPSEAEALLALDGRAFLDGLQERLGGRVGSFLQVGRRHAYPLRLVQAHQQVGSRFAIIGNAAHCIHPNAGQGLNLGLRDVAVLAELVIDAVRQREDPGSSMLLNTYADLRRHDHKQVIQLTDGLAKLFYNDSRAAILVRDLSMIAVDVIPPLKRRLIRRAMGINGRQPRLVCGLPL